MDDLLDLSEAARRCGTTPKALARRIERGTLKAQKDTRTGRRLVTVEALRDAGMDLDSPGNHPLPQNGDASDVPRTSELLDRLERQAAELASVRLLTQQAESQQERDQNRIFELQAELEAARQLVPWWRRKRLSGTQA